MDGIITKNHPLVISNEWAAEGDVMLHNGIINHVP